MCIDSVTLYLSYGGEFVGDSDYVGGETLAYEDYDICWAYDGVQEILENFGFPQIVKVGVRTNKAKKFKFLTHQNTKCEWAKYLRLAINMKKKDIKLYVEALTHDDLTYQRMVIEGEKEKVILEEDIMTERDRVIVDAVIEGDMVNVEVVSDGDEFNEDTDIDDGSNEEYDMGSFDEIQESEDYEPNLIVEESECEDLSGCDFSDDEKEVINARNKIRESRLSRNRDRAILLGIPQEMSEVGFVKSKLYAHNCQDKDFKFELGMKFSDGDECKEAVKMWSIMNGYNIRWTKSGKKRVQAECVEYCPWKLYASKTRTQPTFIIKILHDQHSCIRAKKNRQATSAWLSNQLIDMITRNPNITAAQLQKDVKLKYDLNITSGMCYRTKFEAIQKIRGCYKEDYNKLRSYVAELKRSDKEGRFELKTGLNKKGECIFHRMYVGFSALRKGFLVGCRKLIGFDGCFLKTILGGIMLAAVGKDCNNQMYPIAWAVVEKETTASWTWFCEILFSDFGIDDGFGWSFMSDKQKGLINAIQKLTPNAEHRHCARHVYANWKQKFGGSKFHSFFWTCVKACTVSKYEQALNEMRLESNQAYDEFSKRNPKSFCKSLLVNSFIKADTTSNNICETFNSYILDARDKPIIQMLEDIRKSLMIRMHDITTTIDRYDGNICPNIMRKLRSLDRKTRFCDIVPAADHKYEVTYKNDRYIVDLIDKMCSCVDWHLTGIPCVHAYACINYARHNVENYVDPFYLKATCVATYRIGLQPLPGENEWPKITESLIMPPYVSSRVGRPRKIRKRGADELQKQNPNKLTKHGVRMTCSACGEVGHNKKGCKKIRGASLAHSATAVPSASKTKKGKAKQSHTATEQIRKDKRKAAQGYGLYVSDGGNVIWRNPGAARSQLIATSRAVNDCFQVGERTTAGQASQTVGSQVDNPAPPS